jgi:purine-cytosine permease-like protein
MNNCASGNVGDGRAASCVMWLFFGAKNLQRYGKTYVVLLIFFNLILAISVFLCKFAPSFEFGKG